MADPGNLKPDRETLRLLAEEVVLELPAVDEPLVEAARAAAAGVGLSCGVTYLAGYGVISVASSDQLAEAVDEIQYGAEDGPCLEALRTAVEVRVEDLSVESRWGGYPQLALEAGVRSSLSLPVMVGDGAAGALNVYRTERGPLPADQEAAAILAASQVGGILQAVRRTAAALVGDPEWAAAFRARHARHVAVGMLMARHRCTADDAAALLSQRARAQGVSLEDIVAGLLDSGGREAGLRS